MNSLREHLPGLVRHAGVWEGLYRVVTTEGVEVDRHASRVEVDFPDHGPFDYIQKNRFTWADGRVLEAEHPGVYRDGRLWWDTGLITGEAWQGGDERTCILTWKKSDAPGAQLYELIVLSPDGLTRARTWHWFKEGICYQRTLIDETRIA